MILSSFLDQNRLLHGSRPRTGLDREHVSDSINYVVTLQPQSSPSGVEQGDEG